MRERHSKEPDSSSVNTGSVQPEDGHAPKTYSAREQFAFGVKLFAITGFLVLLFWLANKYV
jgi:hypothetical protein